MPSTKIILPANQQGLYPLSGTNVEPVSSASDQEIIILESDKCSSQWNDGLVLVLLLLLLVAGVPLLIMGHHVVWEICAREMRSIRASSAENMSLSTQQICDKFGTMNEIEIMNVLSVGFTELQVRKARNASTEPKLRDGEKGI